MRVLCTPQVQQHVGPASQRMGLTYQFPRFVHLLTQLDTFLRNRGPAGDRSDTALVPQTWSFKALRPESEQRFPALLVNMLYSVCVAKNLTLQELAHIMDSDAVQLRLLQNKTLSSVQDAFGNTAWHVAAAQADAATLEALYVATDNVPAAVNMWGDSFRDIVCSWGHSVRQLAQWRQALQCRSLAVDDICMRAVLQTVGLRSVVQSSSLLFTDRRSSPMAGA